VRADFQLVGQRLKVGEELLFAWNQPERQSDHPFTRKAVSARDLGEQGRRIVTDPFTWSLQHCYSHATVGLAAHLTHT
jgi:hypothetical protein